jgi:hypothetical protein
VFEHYTDFAASALTFRDLKRHLGLAMQVPYEELASDELSEVIEDAVDVIANQCDGGKMGREACAEALHVDLAKLDAAAAGGGGGAALPSGSSGSSSHAAASGEGGGEQDV